MSPSTQGSSESLFTCPPQSRAGVSATLDGEPTTTQTQAIHLLDVPTINEPPAVFRWGDADQSREVMSQQGGSTEP